MFQFSDSESADSDKGVRFKTDSIRNKEKSIEKDSTSRRNSSSRKKKSKSRSRSPRHRDYKKKKSKKHRRSHSKDDEEQPERHRERKESKRHRHKDRRYDKEESRREHSSPQKKSRTDRAYQTTSPESVRKKQDSEVKPIEISVTTDKTKTSDNNLVLGPALPPHLLPKPNLPTVKATVEPPSPKTEQNIKTNFETETKVVGPALTPSINKRQEDDIYGPKIPNNVGPALTPNLKPIEQPVAIGPALPPGIDKSPEDKEEDDNIDDKVIGPSLPPEIRKRLEDGSLNVEEEEEDVYGPVPEGGSLTRAHVELEERALKMRIDQLEPEGEKQPVREEWMMTLPEAKAAKFGLGPRSFRAKAGPDLSDRSSWTDTPEEKAKKKAGKVEPKVDLQKEAEIKEIRKRDAEQEAVAKKNKKHKESLVEMHQKKLKKDKSDSGPSERRPFSREIDLQVNRFDEAQKKAVLKKAQLLDTRFSAGESKYL